MYCVSAILCGGDAAGLADGAIRLHKGDLITGSQMSIGERDGFLFGVALVDGEHLHDAAALVVVGRGRVKRESFTADLFHRVDAAVFGGAVVKAQVITGGKTGGGLEGDGCLGGIDLGQRGLLRGLVIHSQQKGQTATHQAYH